MPLTNKLGAFTIMNKENVVKYAGYAFWIFIALVVSLCLTLASAEAARTMHLVDEYIDDDVKVCVYSDGRHYEELERNRASSCPYTHIFY